MTTLSSLGVRSSPGLLFQLAHPVLCQPDVRDGWWRRGNRQPLPGVEATAVAGHVVGSQPRTADAELVGIELEQLLGPTLRDAILHLDRHHGAPACRVLAAHEEQLVPARMPEARRPAVDG